MTSPRDRSAAKRSRGRYDFRRKHGLCVDCGRDHAEPDMVRCTACRQDRARMKREAPRGRPTKATTVIEDLGLVCPLRLPTRRTVTVWAPGRGWLVLEIVWPQ